MIKIEFDINDDIFSGIEKIKSTNDSEIDIVIPEGAVLLENKINLKLLNKEAGKLEKILHFQTSDEAGQSLIALIQEDEGINTFENYAAQENVTKIEPKTMPKKRIALGSAASIVLSKFKRNTMAKTQGNPVKKVVIIGVIAALVLFVGLKIINSPVANIKIVVDSQPFAKSVQIRVDKTAFTSADTKTLRGLPVTTTITETVSIDTTGVKTTGKKATGKATIYNRTDTDKTFKKGTTLTYSKSSKDYSFTTSDDITVSAATLQDPADLTSASIPGNKEVDITATDIGTSYNLDKNTSLSVKGEKSSQFTAKVTSDDITGGTSATVKIVAQADKDTLTTNITKVLNDKLKTELASKVSGDQKYIDGSAKITDTNSLFDHQLNDETDKLSITTTASVSGLSYMKNELETLIDNLSQSFIPDGYVLSDKEKTITAEVLGTSETTVLSSDKADLQVTLKAFVVPNISEDSLKGALKGKSPADAETFLSNIKNIKTYSLSINPAIPLLKKVPTDISKINIDITRN